MPVPLLESRFEPGFNTGTVAVPLVINPPVGVAVGATLNRDSVTITARTGGLLVRNVVRLTRGNTGVTGDRRRRLTPARRENAAREVEELA